MPLYDARSVERILANWKFRPAAGKAPARMGRSTTIRGALAADPTRSAVTAMRSLQDAEVLAAS